MSPRRRRGLVLLVVLVAAAAAFLLLRDGDDGRKVTHAELVQEVNEVCSGLVSKGRGLDPPFRPYGPDSESFFAAFLELVEDAKARLADLEPPAADRAALDVLVDGYTAIETDLEEAQGAAAVEQDPEVKTRIAEIEQTTKRMAEAERELGVCKDGNTVAALPALLRRTVPNPLTETGEL